MSLQMILNGGVRWGKREKIPASKSFRLYDNWFQTNLTTSWNTETEIHHPTVTWIDPRKIDVTSDDSGNHNTHHIVCNSIECLGGWSRNGSTTVSGEASSAWKIAETPDYLTMESRQVMLGGLPKWLCTSVWWSIIVSHGQFNATRFCSYDGWLP